MTKQNKNIPLYGGLFFIGPFFRAIMLALSTLVLAISCAGNHNPNSNTDLSTNDIVYSGPWNGIDSDKPSDYNGTGIYISCLACGTTLYYNGC